MSDEHAEIQKLESPSGVRNRVELAASLNDLDRRLLRATAWILLLAALITIGSLVFQSMEYSLAIRIALRGASPDHAASLAYMRALGAAVVKTSALMLAFIVVFLGAMYVLRKATQDYTLAIEAPGWKGSLESASPGLVMVTLGLVTAVFALLSHTNVNYTAPAAATQSYGTEIQAEMPNSVTTPIPAEEGLTMESPAQPVPKKDQP